MSANPRGAASAAANRRWYLEAAGRRAGPFAWTVLVELAQAGALGADDRVWSMGLASWSRATDLADLAPLMRAPAPARSFDKADATGRARSVRWSVLLPVGLCALLLLAVAVSAHFFGHRTSPILTAPLSPSGESPAAYTTRASEFEARYPFLEDLRRVEPSRFEQLDGAVRLGLRRGSGDDELNSVVAETASDIERERLADVNDGGALRLMVELRTAARRFQSSDPGQCVAILRPQSAVAPVRSAAALTAMSPALARLLDAPKGQPRQTMPRMGPDEPDVSTKLACDRLLLLYDAAVTSRPDKGADFIRALQGASGP
jgi:hypothetical protein